MCQHNLPCSIVYAHCLLPGRAFASLYILLFLEKEAEIGGRVIGQSSNSLANHGFGVVDSMLIVIDLMLIVTPIVGFCNCSMFCCALLYVHSSLVII